MKKYFFEAAKKQWEKPTEPKQYLCATAKVTVLAENDEQALELAKAKLREKYLGTNFVLQKKDFQLIDERKRQQNDESA